LHEAQRALAYFEPCLFGAFRKTGQEAAGALKPTVRDRMLATECPRIPREPDGDSGRRSTISALAEQPIRPFARIEHHVGIIEPPRGQREPLERLGALLFAQYGLEC